MYASGLRNRYKKISVAHQPMHPELIPSPEFKPVRPVRAALRRSRKDPLLTRMVSGDGMLIIFLHNPLWWQQTRIGFSITGG